MEQNAMIIRLEKETDYRNTENLVREAFWNVYRPGCTEHYVLHTFRGREEFVPELDFVMEKDGRLIGQVMYVRTVIQTDDGRELPIMTMGPIGIHPAYQRQGYGK
ncbi:MAG: GNAT family N-acetyltransferase, partial [Clostridia bacterium]